MKSVEFLKPGTRSTTRALLFALALSTAAVLSPRTAEAAPGHGIKVCSVGGSIEPSWVNPNPLVYCPPKVGEIVILDRGNVTADYMDRNYPNGLGDNGILPTVRRILSPYLRNSH